MSSFLHSGDIGDLVYGLAVIRKLGGGELFVTDHTHIAGGQPRTGITPDVAAYIASFVKQQPYIRGFHWQRHQPFVSHNLNNFRHYWTGSLHVPCKNELPHLLEMHFACVDQSTDWTPWLRARLERQAPVVFARSGRQQNPHFPWHEAVARYGNRAVFLGLPEEHDTFARAYGPVRYLRTHTLEHVAAVVNAADLIVCNSTSLLAVALGLGKLVVQEVPPTVDRAHTQSCVPYCIDCVGNRAIFPL